MAATTDVAVRWISIAGLRQPAVRGPRLRNAAGCRAERVRGRVASDSPGKRGAVFVRFRFRCPSQPADCSGSNCGFLPLPSTARGVLKAKGYRFAIVPGVRFGFAIGVGLRLRETVVARHGPRFPVIGYQGIGSARVVGDRSRLAGTVGFGIANAAARSCVIHIAAARFTDGSFEFAPGPAAWTRVPLKMIAAPIAVI